eukprot:CAMPEP_0170502368 /NCGR_PEP_ID=MMETSP0208-20121228/41292_1 /TAXON_ID=197538 /ORGANISM="Strombidium inclinatum, Strain S3" /LENGTH=129 /DNA_ID=CAMNT_0010781413 /DNA_START=50 /DNA_END=441 /DNA_ORIENTATION=-
MSETSGEEITDMTEIIIENQGETLGETTMIEGRKMTGCMIDEKTGGENTVGMTTEIGVTKRLTGEETTKTVAKGKGPPKEEKGPRESSFERFEKEFLEKERQKKQERAALSKEERFEQKRIDKEAEWQA